MRYFIKRAHRHFEKLSADNTTIPLVAAGHPKTFNNSGHLEKFLNWVQNQPGVCLDRLTQNSVWWMEPDEVLGQIANSG